MGFGKQVVRAGRDPWLLVTSGVDGGLTWAVLGGALAGGPIGAGLGVAAAMLGVGAAVGALRGDGDDATDSWDEEEAEAIGLRPGTPQAGMVEAIHGYVADLQDLRSSGLPDSVLGPAINGLVAAQGAEQTAVRVAAAVDGLDDALRRSRRPPGQEPRGEALAAVQRMAQRRHALLTKLQHSVDGVAEVYTKLLEMRAAVAALDVGDGHDEVASVSQSLDALRG